MIGTLTCIAALSHLQQTMTEQIGQEGVRSKIKTVAVIPWSYFDGTETAAALLIHIGFTVASGGPKTPHQQRSAQLAIAEAMEPWLKTLVKPVTRKIGGDGRVE